MSDSIWNRIGDVATNAGKNLWKFGGEIVGGVAATARFAWDVGTAPWNDAKEYNGFIQPFKTAAAKEGGAIVKPLASAGGAVMKVPGVAPALEKINKINQEYIREPLSTFGLVQGELNSGRIDALDYFDPGCCFCYCLTICCSLNYSTVSVRTAKFSFFDADYLPPGENISPFPPLLYTLL